MPTWGSLGEYFSSGDTCSFSIESERIPTAQREEQKSGTRERLETADADHWQCPHPATDGHERCLFHLPPARRPDDRSVSDALLDVLRIPAADEPRTMRRRRKQFIGARLPRLSLADEEISGADNFVIDLRAAAFDEVYLDNTTLDDPIDVRGCTAETFSATNASCSRVYAQESEFGTVAFDHATLTRGYFEDVSAELVRFYFSEIEYANFHRADVTHASFMYGTFDQIGFFDVEIDVATFFGAEFGGAYFDDASFGYLNFRSTSGESCHFDDVRAVGATFVTSEFRSGDIDGATFDRVLFDRARWHSASGEGASLGVATFDGAQFGSLLLGDVSIHRSVSFERVTVETEFEFHPSSVDGTGDGYVSWRGAELPRGTLGSPPDTRLIYDFAGATLGDFQIVGTDEQLLGRLRFLRTEFDGFEFGKQRAIDLEATDYTIHELEGIDPTELATLREMQRSVTDLHPAIEGNLIGAATKENETDFEAVDLDAAPTDTGARSYELAARRVDAGDAAEWTADPGVDDLEATYLRAKVGASDVGNSSASGQFFVKERTYRRYGHWEAMFDDRLPAASRLDRASSWFRNGLFAVTTGYGERPRRTIKSSLATIVLFSLPYTYLQPPVEGTADPMYVDYLVFSFQSFITFIVGSSLDDPSLLLRVVSSVEGFVGAFFVALFVFALTRQVHR